MGYYDCTHTIKERGKVKDKGVEGKENARGLRTGSEIPLSSRERRGLRSCALRPKSLRMVDTLPRRIFCVIPLMLPRRPPLDARYIVKRDRPNFC